MSDLCCICNKNIPYIHIEGEGDFCRECHNERMINKFGVSNDFSYSNTIVVREASGTFHTFNVAHIILGSIVSWEANEVGGEYRFRHISDIRNNGAVVAQEFFRKIAEGVNCKTVNLSDYTLPSINDKGNIQVSCSDSCNPEVQFIVDGKKYTPNELASLFAGYEEFNIQYRISDPSAPLLGEDEYLVPVKITPEGLLEELECILNVFSNKGFMDYKRIPMFDEYFYKYITKLEVLYEYKREEAKEVGKKMIEIFENIEHDDDYFPEYIINIINEIITKYD